MKKVLFSHSYFLRFDPKQWKIQQPYPPLATIYAAALMRKKGYEVSLFDTMFVADPEEARSRLQSMKPDYFVLYDDGFNYLTKMCLTNMREAAFQMIAIARESKIPVIVSSSDSTDHPGLYLDAGADFIIYGEGERTLAELLASLESKETDFFGIQGLIFRLGKKEVRTDKRELIRDLDLLPSPAWDLVDIAEYKSRWIKKHGYFSLNVSTTRGCPFHCNWCAKPIYGNRYSVHQPERIVKELVFLNQSFGATHFWMTDDIFGLKPGWIQEFYAQIKRAGIKINFKIQSRVDLLLQENTIEALAKSGCETVWMGAESGSQKILDAMEKGTSVAQIHQATKLLREYGIRPAFFLQFGYPGETKEDIDQTLRMVMALMPDDIGISVSYPLPGTKFYEKVKSELKNKSNWADSDELAMMFHNTYPSDFYKALQRFVHRRYRTLQGLSELRKLFTKPGQFTFAKFRRIAGLPVYFSTSVYYKSRMNKLQTPVK